MAAKPVRCVIFDLDGTLLDTEGLATEAMNEVVAPFTRERCTWALKKKLLGRKGLGEDGVYLTSCHPQGLLGAEA